MRPPTDSAAPTGPGARATTDTDLSILVASDVREDELTAAVLALVVVRGVETVLVRLRDAERAP